MIRALARLVRLVLPRRRWIQFSLGTMFVVVTVLCLWLAWCVDLARRQQTAITELHKLHVAVIYRDASSTRGNRRVESWNKRLLGAAYREPVDYVGFQYSRDIFNTPQQLEQALSYLADIRGPKRLSLEGLPVTDKNLARLKSLVELQKLNLMYTDVTEAGVAELRRALPKCEIVR